MEKRLKLAKKLLKHDGVLIVTIDEHEVHHLGMLLEELFPEYLRHLISIVINPKGTAATNFARVDEYAFFVCPSGSEIIEKMPFDFGLPLPPKKDSRRLKLPIDNNEEDEPTDEDEGEEVVEKTQYFRKLALRRDGAESSDREDRVRQFYAIYVDESTKSVIGIGPELSLDDEFDTSRNGFVVPVYPLDSRGRHKVWRYGRKTMSGLIANNQIKVGNYNEDKDSYSLFHLKPIDKDSAERRKPRTVWWHANHDSGAHGASLLNSIFGDRAVFPFPKSLYAVRDCLNLVTRKRKDALIIDLFSGSGTTFHATCLLNVEDGGSRRCILVSNNEVREAEESLHARGLRRGDPEFEAEGIFEKVTRRRCEAVVTGKRPDGTPIPGAHIGGRAFSEGFEENVSFFKLNYLDPDSVDIGGQFAAIAPALWLAAGAVGECETQESAAGFHIPSGARYGVLFDEKRLPAFVEALKDRPEVTHAFLVTDSNEAYTEMKTELPPTVSSVQMLYRDYLRSFRIQ